MNLKSTKTGVEQLSLFEIFVTEGNEKSDEFVTERAMMDGGVMSQVRASIVQKERDVEICGPQKVEAKK